MADEVLQLDAASVVEDVLQQHGKRLSDIDLASRKAEEASLRRYEAAGWLRKMVGVVAGKDLPAEPSEEELRLGLRSGIILCSVLNKVQPGAVPKVVEAPSDAIIIPDGAALSVFQYFENVRNFLDSIEEMGIPAFEASDLEQGGKSSRIVNCVLALKSYHEWKQGGGKGGWKFGGNTKPPSTGKQFVRKSSDLFLNSLSRNSSTGEKSLDSLSTEHNSLGDPGQDLNEMGISSSLYVLVRELLSDKNREDIPVIVESMLGKVMEEFEHRLASQSGQTRTTSRDMGVPSPHKHVETEARTTSRNMDVPSPPKHVETETSNITKDKSCSENDFADDKPKGDASEYEDLVEVKHQEHALEHQKTSNIMEHGSSSDNDSADDDPNEHALEHQKDMVECQKRRIQELKNTLHSAKEDMQMLRMKYQEEVTMLGKHLNSLARAASGYQKVLEENRKLYNQVQDLKGNIRVYCRIRPFLPGQPNGLSIVEVPDDRTLTIPTNVKHGKGKKSFTFNKVFGPSSTQEEVFSDTQPLIRSVLDGYNVCIFAYGQTGSGKTYTMSGPNELTQETLGVNYRALGDLFLISEQRKDSISYEVSVQMMEIYNEQVRDLLATDGINKKLEIRNNTHNGINVPNANIVPVSTTSDVINLMNLGNKNRAVGSTAMNDRSSRSHSCLTVHVQGRNLTSGSIIRGCMHLVDLAGSERADKTEAVGDRLKEAQHINRSLSALGDVIFSLAQKQSHVPYRNSKLTQLLQDSLGGQAKTLMFVHISPEPDALGETISTLKFAERVSTVELGAARANKDSTDVRELKEQIANLKAALSRKERGESGIQQSRSISPDRAIARSYGSSTSNSSWQSIGLQGPSNDSSTSRMQIFDTQDLMDSPPWPALSSPGSVDEEKSLSGDWVDKVMMKKQGGDSGKWDEDGRQSPEILYHKYGHRRHSLDNGSAVTDESDDLEAETSDSSELDYQLQLNASKSNTSIPSGVGSKLRKPSPKQTKIPEIRSQIPQPSTRRVSSGMHSSLPKHARQPASTDGKRRPGGAK